MSSLNQPPTPSLPRRGPGGDDKNLSIEPTIIFTLYSEKVAGNMKSNVNFLNSIEAAKILGVNVSSIKRWTDEGKLECIKTAGGHRKFLMHHLAKFLEINKKKKSQINVFPIENESDIEVSFHILKGDFKFLKDFLLKHARVGNRHAVQKVLNGIYLGQYPLHVIYDKLITPVLYKIGNLWMREEISIIEEHLASQAIRDALIRLQGLITIPEEKIGNVLCLNPASELHDIALKMVEHILEVRGFRTYYSGQLTPMFDVQNIFEKFRPERMYVSVTIVENSKALQEEINHIFDLSLQYETKIFIGGRGWQSLDDQHPAVVARLKSFEDVYTS
jgi:excisionase family DNA binding protein